MKRSHVGVQIQSSGNCTPCIILCKFCLLFSLKNISVDHVSEIQEYYGSCIIPGTKCVPIHDVLTRTRTPATRAERGLLATAVNTRSRGNDITLSPFLFQISENAQKNRKFVIRGLPALAVARPYSCR